jgi:hypothetical protein
LRKLVVFAALGLFACSPADNNNGMDMTPPGPDLGKPEIDMNLPARDPTDHPPLLQMTYNGGPVLANMELWTVVWAGDEGIGQQVNDYVNWMFNKAEYWNGTLSEYNVGKGTAMGVIVLPTAKPATLDDAGVGPLVKSIIAGAPFNGTTTANTVISFVIPTSTHSTMGGGAGCVDYDGYHAETRKATGSTTYVPYMVNVQCAGEGFDGFMETISHESSETATDPHPFTKPGYSSDGQPFGGEISDLCNPLAAHYMAQRAIDGGTVLDVTYAVARNWSNKAAAVGTSDPCVPAPAGHPYYNVAVNPSAPTFALPSDPNGADYYIQFEPYSFGDVGEIKWELLGAPGTGITVSPDFGVNKAGDTIFVTVHVDKTAQSGTYAILLYAQAAQGGENYWTSPLTLQ